MSRVMKGVKADPRVVVYKQAAEIFCKRTGRDPEEQVKRPHQFMVGVDTLLPTWYCVAEEMFVLVTMIQSINVVGAQAIQAQAQAKATEGESHMDRAKKVEAPDAETKQAVNDAVAEGMPAKPEGSDA